MRPEPDSDSDRRPRVVLLEAALVAVLLLSAAWNHRALIASGEVGGTAADALDAALFDAGATSPALGLAVFGILLYARRASIGAALGAPPRRAIALAAGGAGLVLLGWSRAIGADELALPALILELIGAAAWLGGGPLLAAIAFPLLALVLVIPPPALLLDALLFPLQRATVWLASLLLDGMGRHHVVAGDLIETRGTVFQVIEGCSGLKTMTSLALAAVAYAELVGRRGYEKLVVVAVAPVVGFFVNGLRVLALILGRVPTESLAHQLYGLAAIVLGVVLLAVVELGLSRTLFRIRPGRALAANPTGSPLARRRRLAWLAFGSVATLPLVALVPSGFVRGPAVRLPNIEALPRQLDGLEAAGELRVDDAWLGRVHFAHRFYRAYAGPDGERLRVFVGVADPERRDVGAYSAKTAIPTSGWLALERLDPLEPGGASASAIERLRLRYPARHAPGPAAPPEVRRDAAQDEGTSARGVPSPAAGRGASATADREVIVEHARLGFAPWEIELLSSWLGLARLRSDPAPVELVIRVEAEVSGDREATELRLRQFTNAVLDWYRAAG